MFKRYVTHGKLVHCWLYWHLCEISGHHLCSCLPLQSEWINIEVGQWRNCWFKFFLFFPPRPALISGLSPAFPRPPPHLQAISSFSLSIYSGQLHSLSGRLSNVFTHLELQCFSFSFPDSLVYALESDSLDFDFLPAPWTCLQLCVSVSCFWVQICNQYLVWHSFEFTQLYFKVWRRSQHLQIWDGWDSFNILWNTQWETRSKSLLLKQVNYYC